MNTLITILCVLIYILVGYGISSSVSRKTHRVFFIHVLLFWPTVIVTVLIDQLCDILEGIDETE